MIHDYIYLIYIDYKIKFQCELKERKIYMGKLVKLVELKVIQLLIGLTQTQRQMSRF